MNRPMASDKRESMGGLAKGLAIIEAFSVNSVMSVADAARASGATRAAARRCLLTLVDLDYLEQSGREYRPLPRLRRLGGAASDRDRLVHVVSPFLARARDDLAESVSLAVLEADQSLFVARAEAQHIVATGVRIGASLPLYCSATGRVLLSGQTDDDIEATLGRTQIVARTPHGLTDPADILAAIKAARKNGSAISDQELALGLRSLAVPVFGKGTEVIAAVSVSAASARVKVTDLHRRFLPVLKACADDIARSLGKLR